ncbi:GNAT family N-acetyltransferase [Amnibacterium kyonggiense]
MSDADDLLAAYDAQLRGAPEIRAAARPFRLGPLWIGVLAGTEGFIGYRDLGGLAAGGVRGLVRAATAVLAADAAVARIEWKTRQHDAAPGLHDALLEAGYEPQEAESIMIGAAELLALDLPVPDGVVLRSVTEPADVRRASFAADLAFGEEPDEARAAELVERIATGDDEMWIAEIDGDVVCTGRLSPVPGTRFAGIWGGATRADQRHRGIYRALTAARARSALGRGVRFINSDSTEHSRPILERSGFTKVSSTTPYEWHR